MATKPISAEVHVATDQSNSVKVGYRILAFALTCAVPIVIAWDVIRRSSRWPSPTIPTLTFRSSRSLAGSSSTRTAKRSVRESSSQWQPGTPLLAAGLAAVVAARLGAVHLDPSQDLSLAMLGAVLVWIGAFAMFFGYAAFRAARFALLFLIFTVPIPEPVLSQSIHFLQVWSAHSAAALFSLFGIPYLQNDLVFNLPGVAIRVAEECSGIRSTLALLIMTVLGGAYVFEDYLERVSGLPFGRAALDRKKWFAHRRPFGIGHLCESGFSLWKTPSVWRNVFFRGRFPAIGSALS